MSAIHGHASEIHELARYEVRPESLEQCLAAIHEFVAYVRANEPGALRYEVWQEAEQPTRFVHLFVWRDAGSQPHSRRIRCRQEVCRHSVSHLSRTRRVHRVPAGGRECDVPTLRSLVQPLLIFGQ